MGEWVSGCKTRNCPTALLPTALKITSVELDGQQPVDAVGKDLLDPIVQTCDWLVGNDDDIAIANPDLVAGRGSFSVDGPLQVEHG